MKHIIAYAAIAFSVTLFIIIGCSFKSSDQKSEQNPEQNGIVAQNGDGRGLEVVPAGNQYALLIGVNEYARPVKSLRYCVNDMKLLAESFERIGVPKENIFLVTDDSPAERRPTGANIRQQIEVVTQLMGPNDQLTIAFSGHGAMVNGQSYLCPSDTNVDNPNTIIPRDWVFAQLEKCKANQKIFIIDACRDEFSFGDPRALGGARTLEDPVGADTHGFILIASCDKTQKSWEHSNLQHGVFTFFLAEGLAGAAQDEDGFVSIMSIFQYASAKTKKFVYREFNKAQVPTIRLGDEMTDFYLARVVTPTTVTTYGPLKAGDRQVHKVNDVEFVFRYCPPGTFTMGSPTSERGRWKDEKSHQITLSEGFWMMETEVTQKQWKAVMGSNPSLFENDNLPVENVSWNDCQEFCKRCTQLGLPVQLPTEAQWEYACRAGSTGAYAGNLDEIAWYNSNSGKKTHPVKTKKPNAWGLYDMNGNVWEWCVDWYGDYPNENVTDPSGPSTGAYRVLRGGGWNGSARSCRSACRNCPVPGCRSNFLGIRCVKGQ